MKKGRTDIGDCWQCGATVTVDCTFDDDTIPQVYEDQPATCECGATATISIDDGDDSAYLTPGACSHGIDSELQCDACEDSPL